MPKPIRRTDSSIGDASDPLAVLVEFLGTYMAMPRRLLIVVATWVIAAWLIDVWDRFPHLGVSSPGMRCGKSTLLKLLRWITPNAYLTPNASAAAIYRLIEGSDPKPTFLLDESQSLNRLGSEAAEVNRELFNSGIDRDAGVLRCMGKNSDVVNYSLYSPKVLALIGELDDVLADRCLPIRLHRKTADEVKERYRDRKVQPHGERVVAIVQEWEANNRERVAEVYDALEPFSLDNDRLAELLLALQAVLTVLGNTAALDELRAYAQDVAAQTRDTAKVPDDVLLLRACREVFNGQAFLPTETLIRKLCKRDEDPWAMYVRGEPITAHKLGRMLDQYGIKSAHSKDRSQRGYDKRSFQDAWDRYVPESQSDASASSQASGRAAR